MKRNIILLALIALIFSGCRKDADYHPYIGEYDKLAYDSYSTQFDYIWKCISTGYVLWDVDDTDWDAVYDEYMPKFQALDAKHEAGQDVELLDEDSQEGHYHQRDEEVDRGEFHGAFDGVDQGVEVQLGAALKQDDDQGDGSEDARDRPQ